jgi:hypothetical protein
MKSFALPWSFESHDFLWLWKNSWSTEVKWLAVCIEQSIRVELQSNMLRYTTRSNHIYWRTIGIGPLLSVAGYSTFPMVSLLLTEIP